MRRTSAARRFENSAAARKSGFTLLEVLVAAVVAALVLGLVAAVMGQAASGVRRIHEISDRILFLRELELQWVSSGTVPDELTVGRKTWKLTTEVEHDGKWMLVHARGVSGERVICALPRAPGGGN